MNEVIEVARQILQLGEHGHATEGQADVGAVAFGFHVGLPAGDNQGALDVALISNLEKESKQYTISILV